MSVSSDEKVKEGGKCVSIAGEGAGEEGVRGET